MVFKTVFTVYTRPVYRDHGRLVYCPLHLYKSISVQGPPVYRGHSIYIGWFIVHACVIFPDLDTMRMALLSTLAHGIKPSPQYSDCIKMIKIYIIYIIIYIYIYIYILTHIILSTSGIHVCYNNNDHYPILVTNQLQEERE